MVRIHHDPPVSCFPCVLSAPALRARRWRRVSTEAPDADAWTDPTPDRSWRKGRPSCVASRPIADGPPARGTAERASEPSSHTLCARLIMRPVLRASSRGSRRDTQYARNADDRRAMPAWTHTTPPVRGPPPDAGEASVDAGLSKAGKRDSRVRSCLRRKRPDGTPEEGGPAGRRCRTPAIWLQHAPPFCTRRVWRSGGSAHNAIGRLSKTDELGNFIT